jgi:hypothetical protein
MKPLKNPVRLGFAAASLLLVIAACSGSSSNDLVATDAGGPDSSSGDLPDGAHPADSSSGGDSGCGITEKSCNGACVSQTDPAYGCTTNACSACAVAHAVPMCALGACGVASCNAGYGDCNAKATDGCETEVATAHDHCGTCDNACAANQVCSAGKCANHCAPPTTNCGGSCVDVSTDPAHCSDCNTVCTAPANGVATCAAGHCGFTCAKGYVACAGSCLTSCGTDGGIPDAASDAPPPPPDGSVTLPGVQLRPGTNLTLWGTTTDGYVIYYDHVAATLNAIPLAGGAPQLISNTLGSNFGALAYGKVVFVWSKLDANNVGALSTWSAADGTHAVTNASAEFVAAADPTSKFIVYAANWDGTGNGRGDLYGAFADGTQATRLVSAASGPFLGGAGSYLWSTYSQAADAGTVYATDTYAILQGFATAHIAPGTFSILQSTDTAGTLVLTADDNGLQVFPMAGGVGVTIDPNGFNGGQLTGDGKTVVYANDTALLRSPSSAASPTTLASGSLSLYALSPNEQTALVYMNATTLGIASAVTPGAVTPIAPNTNLGFTWYTGDSSRVVYLTNYNVGNSGTGTLNTFPVGGTSGTVIDQNVSTWRSSGATKIVFDNLANLAADIKVIDAAKGGTPNVVVTGAHPTWLLTRTRDKIIYSWSQTLGPEAGIYVAPVP